MFRSRVLLGATRTYVSPNLVAPANTSSTKALSIPSWIETADEARLDLYKARYIKRLNNARSHIRSLRTRDHRRTGARLMVNLWKNCLAAIDARKALLNGTEKWPRLHSPFPAVYQHRNPLLDKMIVRPVVSRPDDLAYMAMISAERQVAAAAARGEDVSAAEAVLERAKATLDAAIAEKEAVEAAEAAARAKAAAEAAKEEAATA